MKVRLEAFEGPLDLLLSLIQKNEIDIYDIPMSDLTRQYLEIIKKIPPDMDGMSEFLLMAATLLEIKSSMLLPRHATGGDEEKDPREALVQQLIAYEHCKELAKTLQDLPNVGARLFKKPEYPLMAKAVNHSPGDWLAGVSAIDLHETFLDVMLRQTRKVDTVRSNFGKVAKDRHTVKEKIKMIEDRLKEVRKLRLSELFVQCKNKEECVVTFLALLEMIRQRQAIVRQKSVFGEVEILPCPA